ncbi:zinc finger protein 37-like isoform X2 [Bacillus rossius redtenbacheri]|uniref:zinc finger protein 37-like isoform X2 n=1 Tax=Bacillus rossius redtenbacheri TaxID=93214 RepID=UPI002FDE4E68
MNDDWKRWCRLCAVECENSYNIIENEFFLREKILKYLSIVVASDDELSQQVCKECSQRLSAFDSYAEKCRRVQAMFERLEQRGLEADLKVGHVREQYLRQAVLGDEIDAKKDVEMLAVDVDPFIPSDSNTTMVSTKRRGRRKRGGKVLALSRIRKRRSTKKPAVQLWDYDNECDRECRVSTRLQTITNMEKENAALIEVDIKIESQEENVEECRDHLVDDKIFYKQRWRTENTVDSSNELKSVSLLPKKRGRPPKALVGAAKRKAKIPRNVKPKLHNVNSNCSSKHAEDIVETQPTAANVETSMDADCENKMDSDSKKCDPLGDDESDGNSGRNKRADTDEKMWDTKKGRKVEMSKLPSIFRWDCHVCGQVCPNWNSLSIHCRRAHQEAAHVVCLCAKVLASRASIIKHRLKHTNGYKYKCDKCEKAFHRRALFEIHLLSHVPKEEQPFVCCKCARRFHCEALLRQHERVHLPKEERLINPCDICGKKFSSKSAVSAHLKAVHFGERPFVCDQCGHSFTSKGILQEHLTIHSDETPFKCTSCKKSFKTKYRLKIHADTHRETPYQCPVCSLQLNTRRTLRMHLVVHRDTKAYQCATCGKAFRRAKDLKNHHNLHTGRRPYTCTFCPRTFANGSNCRSHKRRMHPEELRAYEASLAAAENTEMKFSSAADASVNVGSSGSLSGHTEQSLVELDIGTNVPQHSSLESLSKPSSDLSMQEMNMYMNPLPMKVSVESPPISQASMNPANSASSTYPDYHRSSDHEELSCTSLNHNANSHTLNRPLSSHMTSISSPLLRESENVNLQNSQAPSRNGQMPPGDISCSVASIACHSVPINLNSRRNTNAASSESLLHSSHLPALTPLNLNISEIHSSRQQTSGLSIMEESELLSRRRLLENFQPSAGGLRHHIPGLNSNLPQVNLQHQLHHNGLSLSRSEAEQELLEMNRTSIQREMIANNGVNHVHHPSHTGSEHVSAVHEFSTSLNHLYTHQPPLMTSVAAAIAHSSTVGVPAFPGNPYMHRNTGYKYNRGNTNL